VLLLIDRVLTNTVMMGMNGAGLACRLAASWSRSPIIVISGYSGAEGPAGDGLGRLVRERFWMNELSAEIESTTERACAAPVV
jgi:hypothetical protein